MPKHVITERMGPLAVMLRCSCGKWERNITRAQNALARAAKVKAAKAQHLREAEEREAAR